MANLRKVDDDAKKEIIQLFKETNLTIEQIATIYGINYRTLWDFLSNNLSPEELDRTDRINVGLPKNEELYDAVKNADRTEWGWQAKLAKKLNLSRQRISTVYNDLIKKGEID